MYDLSISGSWGLYSIAPLTEKGKDWAKKHLSEDTGERTHDECGNIMCDGGERCRDIVAGAIADGLAVEVNGTDMKGYGQTRESVRARKRSHKRRAQTRRA